MVHSQCCCNFFRLWNRYLCVWPCRPPAGDFALICSYYKANISAFKDLRPIRWPRANSHVHICICSKLEEPCLRRTARPLIWPICSSPTHFTRNKRRRRKHSCFFPPRFSPVCRRTHPALFARRLLFGDRCRTPEHKSGLLESAEWKLASINQLTAIDYDKERDKKKGESVLSWRCVAKMRLEGLRSAMEN